MVDNYDEKLNQNVVFLGGTRGLIIMYGDVSERIGMYRDVSGVGFLAKNQARYVPIRPDTFIFEGFLAKNQGRYVPIRSDTSRYVQI